MKTLPKKLKLAVKTIIITGLLNITSLSILTMGLTTHAQQIEINILLNNWHLDTYIVSDKKYPPNKKEKEDFMLFNADMSFVSKSEGKQEKGIYTFNKNGQYIVMTDEMRAIEVHYNSSI